MRKIVSIVTIVSIVSIISLSFSSCGDYLEVEPQNMITVDKFWNEKSDVESVIASCYSTMQSYAVISRMMIWGEFRSENLTINGEHITQDVSLERILNENLTANNSYTYWGDFYTVINRCNTIMKYAPQVAAVDPAYTESALKAHIAEATALRSLCYFYLIRTFRDVPYSEEPFISDDQTLDLPATTFENVLDSLIFSLEEVAGDAVWTYYSLDNVKESSTEYQYNTGRITRAAIYAMLSEMYLWKKDYDKCIYYADIVIDRKKYDQELKDKQRHNEEDYSEFYDFPLISTRMSGFSNSYGAAFNDIFVDGNSDESIFELNFIKGSEGNMASNGPVSNFFGNSGRAAFVRPSDYIASDVSLSTPQVFVNKYDGRAYENFRFTGSSSSDATASGINKYTCSSSVRMGDPNTNSFYTNSSWGTMYPTYGSSYDSRNKSNYIIYRLTDVMLLKAEALTQQITDDASINTEADKKLRDEAFAIVTSINKRSMYQYPLKDTLNVNSYASKDKIVELVYSERQRELMFEGKRYYDLVRRAMREGKTDYLRGKAKQRDSESASVIDSKLTRMEAIFWPYNLDELKVNKNLVQNPAFGSGENQSWE